MDCQGLSGLLSCKCCSLRLGSPWRGPRGGWVISTLFAQDFIAQGVPLEGVRADGEGSGGPGLADAYALIRNAPTADSGRLNWEEVVKPFMSSREDRRATTRRDPHARMDRTLQTLQSKPSPKHDRVLRRAYAAQH